MANLADASQNSGEAFDDIYKSVEGLVGSAHHDRLAGDAGCNILMGHLGNDTLSGYAGNDLLQGEPDLMSFMAAMTLTLQAMPMRLAQ